jgi:hypothetical protein
MKNLVYSFAVLLGFYLAGCSKADNLSGGAETQPVVTVYSYDVPADADPDVTVNLRFIPNTVCDKFYVLVEKKADKDAFVKSNGEAAYADKVVAQGAQYPAEITDYFNASLPGNYTITAVPVSAGGEKGKSAEFVFNGFDFQLVGTAYYSDGAFTPVSSAPAQWYVLNLETPIYKLAVTISAWNNYRRIIKLNWDSKGALTFYNGEKSTRDGYWMFPTPYTHATYGAYWQEVDLNPKNSYYDKTANVIYMNTRRVVSAGAFTGWYPVVIALP